MANSATPYLMDFPHPEQKAAPGVSRFPHQGQGVALTTGWVALIGSPLFGEDDWRPVGDGVEEAPDPAIGTTGCTVPSSLMVAVSWTGGPTGGGTVGDGDGTTSGTGTGIVPSPPSVGSEVGGRPATSPGGLGMDRGRWSNASVGGNRFSKSRHLLLMSIGMYLSGILLPLVD